MCWNETVSLNTFVFGIATLIFIWYNNTYTQYKITEFKNIYFYFSFFSILSLQLVDYFLWKSINTKNNFLNKIFSIFGWIFIRICQPLGMLLLIPKEYDIMKYLLFIIYFLSLIIVSIYKYFYNPVEFKTVVDKNGHLYWKWIDLYNYERIIFLFYFILLLTIYFTYPSLAFFVIFSFIYNYLIYKNSWGSMWCWTANLLSIYFLIKILFILPYYEYNELC
jgi:hypothetical protein